MARKRRSSTPTAGAQIPKKGQIAARSSDIAEILSKADALLQAGVPKKALDLLARARINSPWLTNALAVCQLRLGNTAVAVDVFRGLVLGSGGVVMREDVPTVFKTNFAAALLQAGNVDGCLGVLAEVGEGHASIDNLRAAIDRWKKSLTLWERIRWYMGDRPDRPVVLDFPPGDLE